MALYLRLLGIDPTNPKVQIHPFQSVIAEWSRGKITGTQANVIIGQLSGSVDVPKPLTASEITEATTLVGTITSIVVPAAPAALGANPSANALRDYALAWGTRDQALAQRALRALEIDQCLLLADNEAPGYATEAELKAKLGV